MTVHVYEIVMLWSEISPITINNPDIIIVSEVTFPQGFARYQPVWGHSNLSLNPKHP